CVVPAGTVTSAPLVATTVVAPFALAAATAPTGGALPREAPLKASPDEVPLADSPLVCPEVGKPLAVVELGVGCGAITGREFAAASGASVRSMGRLRMTMPPRLNHSLDHRLCCSVPRTPRALRRICL